MLKRLLLILILFHTFILGQPSESLNSAEIKIALEKLNTLGSVLYIAAHPDDENTAFLAYFNYAEHMRTGYLSLTRGDGGQNLIGEEQSDLLGVIRTQELLQARSIDGAEQFFTRAVDFGYSKTADETLAKWDKEKILSDVIWVIRKFKPDVIVTRFPSDNIGTHGHHTSSALLALEAFKLSGNSKAFPEQLKYVETWQPKRVFWNAWTSALNSVGINADTLIKINLGDYNNLLGRSYTEISAESRTMHKSQGFGASGRRENLYNYFLLEAGEFAADNIFDGINVTWDRVKGSQKVSELLKDAYEQFSFENPSSILPLLIDAYYELQKLDDKYWVDVKSSELINVIKSCAGIWTEAVTDQNLVCAGSNLKVDVGFVIRSDFPVLLKSVEVDYQSTDSTLNAQLTKGEMISFGKEIKIPDDAKYSQPYWLAEGNHKDVYIVDDQKLIGQPKTDHPLYARFITEINGVDIKFGVPVFYRTNDPVDGEVYKRVEIVPKAVINFNKDLYLVKNNDVKEISVFVRNFKEGINGTVKLISDSGWEISPDEYKFNFLTNVQEQEFTFNVHSVNNHNSGTINAELIIDGKKLSKSLVIIDYPHIQPQTVLFDAKAKIVKLDFDKLKDIRIAYIMGSGDKIPELLDDLSFSVDLFINEPLTPELLKKYDVVITGIRAYNTNQRLATDQKNLLNFVEQGGTLIVQYNTSREMNADPSPYSLNISRERVTEEDSPVIILDENAKEMNYPYTISLDDFKGWTQERGLYFPDEWNENFNPLLEMNDKGESPKKGSLLVAKYGDGIFIYTGLSFFRQLPAGVEGAYKLFINLLYAGVNE